MAVKERSQIKGTDAQIKAFAGHNGVLAFATDTKSLHVLSGTAGTTTEFLPSTKVATKDSLATVATSGAYSDLTGTPTIDTALSTTSTNAVQNKIVKAAIQAVADVCYQVGDLRLYAGTDVPDGWFRCDGSTVANMQTNYPKLYAVLGTNILPNSSGMCLQGAVSGIGTNMSAGLPNITGIVGRFRFSGKLSPVVSGAFIYSPPTSAEGDAIDTFLAEANLNLKSRSNSFAIDASVSDAVYGRASTVQPPALKVAVLIRHD